MTFGLQNLLMLCGLAAVAIPPLIHLLHRRRYDVVDWGAMQFLQVSRTTRRRLLLEEVLLMLLRMGMIAVLVLALAGPYASGSAVSSLADASPRDVVVILDGSASMAQKDGEGKTPLDAAPAWVEALLEQLSAGDRVAFLVARDQVTPLVGSLTPDHAQIREKLGALPPSRGSCDWPGAIERALHILRDRDPTRRQEIILVGDGQRFGWADDDALHRWHQLAPKFADASSDSNAGDGGIPPRLRAMFLTPTDDTSSRPNYSLAPLRTARRLAWVGQSVKLTSALKLTGLPAYEAPWRIDVEVDGRHIADLPIPDKADSDRGQVPLSFEHRFTTPGSHLVSLIVVPDPPIEKRPVGYRSRDCLSLDNRQDIAVEVREPLPVLLVDGDERISSDGPTYFLEKALKQSPQAGGEPVVRPRVIPYLDLDPSRLESGPAGSPRVAVLADVPRLTAKQRAAVERFVATGGGLLVLLGERVDRAFYNDRLFQGGVGLLPARLETIRENVAQPAALDMRRSLHPALTTLGSQPGGLERARFPRWWQITPARDTATGASLTTGDPLLVERQGSTPVMVCAVPLDRSWNGNLPGTPEFPVLVHELIYYLAGAQSTNRNLVPGQPLRYGPERGDEISLPARLSLESPERGAEVFHVERWPWTHEGVGPPGVYRLRINDQRTIHFVIQADPRESDLTPCSAADLQRVAGIIPIDYLHETSAVDSESDQAALELWWLLLIALSGLLCVELWLTRRMTVAES